MKSFDGNTPSPPKEQNNKLLVQDRQEKLDSFMFVFRAVFSLYMQPNIVLTLWNAMQFYPGVPSGSTLIETGIRQENNVNGFTV